MIFVLFTLLIFPLNVLSQTKTATATPTVATGSAEKTQEDKDIENLKEKIANRVAELRKDQKAVSGTVEGVTGNEIKLQTKDHIDYKVTVDDALTKIYQIPTGIKKEIKLTDIKKGAYIIVSGPLIDKTIAANVVYEDDRYEVKSGKITQVDKVGFIVDVVTTEKDEYTLDVETFTRTQMVDAKTLELQTVGFTKLKEGDSIHFVIKKTGTEKENRFAAQKILIIPQEYFIK